MNSSSQAHSSARTGAHRAHGRTPHETEQPPPFRHEPYLDGLFTYCLSVLCDHDTATDVLGDVLAVAERHPGRCPDEGTGAPGSTHSPAGAACTGWPSNGAHDRERIPPGVRRSTPGATVRRVAERNPTEARTPTGRLT